MSTESTRAFLERLTVDEAFADQLVSALATRRRGCDRAVVAFLGANGFEVTPEEIAAISCICCSRGTLGR